MHGCKKHGDRRFVYSEQLLHFTTLLIISDAARFKKGHEIVDKICSNMPSLKITFFRLTSFRRFDFDHFHTVFYNIPARDDHVW